MYTLDENAVQALAFHVRWFINQAETDEERMARYKKVYEFLVKERYEEVKRG